MGERQGVPVPRSRFVREGAGLGRRVHPLAGSRFVHGSLPLGSLSCRAPCEPPVGNPLPCATTTPMRRTS